MALFLKKTEFFVERFALCVLHSLFYSIIFHKNIIFSTLRTYSPSASFCLQGIPNATFSSIKKRTSRRNARQQAKNIVECGCSKHFNKSSGNSLNKPPLRMDAPQCVCYLEVRRNALGVFPQNVPALCTFLALYATIPTVC